MRSTARGGAILGAMLFASASAAPAQVVAGEAGGPQVGPVPAEERERLELDEFYEKAVFVGGFPILASAKVRDEALLEAAFLIERMLRGRDDVRQAMVDNKVRFVVMAYDERTTAVPEHSDLRPSRYWDRRARGLGATLTRPAVSCGEENLLQFPGDPYHTENILIHEFAHAMHEMGLNTVQPEFHRTLTSLYRRAMAEGLWKGKYAATNPMEYWAECVQSFFGTNRENDHDHNHVNTREELKEYDPRIHDLIEASYRDHDWRYVFPSDRSDKGHLEGWDRSKAPRFAWDPELQEWYDAYEQEQREQREKQGQQEQQEPRRQRGAAAGGDR